MKNERFRILNVYFIMITWCVCACFVKAGKRIVQPEEQNVLLPVLIRQFFLHLLLDDVTQTEFQIKIFIFSPFPFFLFKKDDGDDLNHYRFSLRESKAAMLQPGWRRRWEGRIRTEWVTDWIKYEIRRERKQGLQEEKCNLFTRSSSRSLSTFFSTDSCWNQEKENGWKEMAKKIKASSSWHEERMCMMWPQAKWKTARDRAA